MPAAERDPSSGPLFANRVCIVVGAGQGLGRRYALDLGAAGAKVVVVGRSENARGVAGDIVATGGSAVAVIRDARDGDGIAADAIDAYGTIDAMLLNAGITRDRSLAKMSADEWREVTDVHLGSAFACSRAVWPHFVKRGGGALLFTTSGAGLHGSFGQANYAAAKAGIIGLTFALAVEGAAKNIRVNAIAPMAATAMTTGVFSDAMNRALTVEGVSPFALALLHPTCPATGRIVEAGGGWAAAVRWERSAGLRLDRPDVATVLARWHEIEDFGAGSDFPTTTAHSLAAAVDHDRPGQERIRYGNARHG